MMIAKLLLFYFLRIAISTCLLPPKNFISKPSPCFDMNLNTHKPYQEFSKTVGENKIIAISPGGYHGFYMMGISNYIKENYDLSNYLFTGASAGAWNALFMTYKGDPTELALRLLSNEIIHNTNIKDIIANLKKELLLCYKDNDFDVSRLFIGITNLNDYYMPIVNIYSDFENLEDAIDCCIASSHIPFITGNFIHKYNKFLSFDGQFSSYPYPYLENKAKDVFYITPSMWEKSKSRAFFDDIHHYANMIKKGKTFDLSMMYDKGYYDSKKNKHKLDAEFLDKNF